MKVCMSTVHARRLIPIIVSPFLKTKVDVDNLYIVTHSFIMNPDEQRLLNELRPIFPQYQDDILMNCIRAVRDPNALDNNIMDALPQCIDLLLMGAENGAGNPFGIVEGNPFEDVVFVREEMAGMREHIAPPVQLAANNNVQATKRNNPPSFDRNNYPIDIDNNNPFGDWNEPSDNCIDLNSSDSDESENGTYSNNGLFDDKPTFAKDARPFVTPNRVQNEHATSRPQLASANPRLIAPPKFQLHQPGIPTPTSAERYTSTPIKKKQIQFQLHQPGIPTHTSAERLTNTPIQKKQIQFQLHQPGIPTPTSAERLTNTPIQNNHIHGANVHSSTSNSPVNIPEPSPIDRLKNQILIMFPDVEINFLQRHVNDLYPTNTYEDVLNTVCNYLLEYKDYPKLVNTQGDSTNKSTDTAKDSDSKNYFQDYTDPIRFSYESSLVLLQNEFRHISTKDIRTALGKFHGHYAPAYKCLEDSIKALKELSTATSPSTSPFPSGQQPTISPLSITSPTQPSSILSSPFIIKITLLKSPSGRALQHVGKDIHPELMKEVDFVNKRKKLKAEEMDMLIAVSMNEKEYEEEGQMIECGCCYGEASFENMVQCLDGHLFCKDCLFRYAQEAVYGSGKLLLMCMSDGCDSSYPKSQLIKALPTNLIDKYEDRLQEESLCLAEMEDLVRCPHCDFAAIMPPNDKVFKCLNEKCMKESCRYCKEDWAEHFGIPCKEIEKKSQTSLRVSYEEKMTMAKIRSCVKCKSSFTKDSGCNKMTCRCGQTMCYICRKPSINYGHFCQHPRDPGHKCKVCKACSLWSNPDEDDELAIKQLQEEADTEKRKLEETFEPLTSPVNHEIQPPPKRARTAY